MKSLSITMALTTLCGLATSQSEVPADKTAPWARFQAQFPGDWQVAWCEATGTPEAIWGPGMRVQGDAIPSIEAARRHARSALERHKDLLGQGGSQFVEEIAHKVERVHIFVYRQRYKGLPVIGGRADVRIHDNGVLSMLGSQALPIPDNFKVTPTIGLGAARTVAYRHLALPKPEKTRRANRLVVWGDIFMKARSPVKLAWEVDIDVPTRLQLGRAYVDAATGKFLRYETDLHDCGFAGCKKNGKSTRGFDKELAPLRIDVIPDPNPDPNKRMVGGQVMAWTNTSLKPNDPLVNVPLRNLAVGSTFTDGNGQFSLAGSSATVTITLSGRRMGGITAIQGTAFSRTVTLTGTNNIIQIYASSAVEYDRSQTTTYYYTDLANEFVRSIIGNPTQLARIDQIRANVNTARSCNATYSTANVMNFYHAAGGCPNTAYNTVVMHEWGHGFDQEFGGIQRNEGMSEGSADVVPMVYNDDPIVGHDFRGPNTFVRTGTNTKQYPPSGGVHSQGEVWMGFCWDVRNELVARLGQPAGVTRLRELFIGYFVANPNSQSSGAREVAIIDDDDGNLNNGTPNCHALTAALTKRNIPNPISGCPGIASYSTFGAGCPGSGVRGTNCHSKNATCTTGSPTGTTIKYAYECTAGQGGAQIVSVDVFTRARTVPVAGRIEIRLANASGAPRNIVARTASANLTTAHRFYTFTFAQPLTVPQGQKFFIVYPGDVNMAFPLCTASTPRETVPYYFQRAGTTTWTSVPTGTFWAFRVRCQGGPGAIPQLTNTGSPVINSSFQLHLMAARPNARALLVVGLSKTSWPPFALPLSLAPFGAPNCSILASAEAMLSVNTDAQGAATVQIAVPNDPNLLNTQFYNQFVIFDAPANAMGLAVSDGGEGAVGK